EEIARLDLVENVAPVQLAIRLLIPAGSRLLELPEVRTRVGPFDEAALVHPWVHPDPRVDALQREVEGMVRESAARGEGRAVAFERALDLAERAAGERARVRHDARRELAPHVAREPRRPPVP